MFRDVLKESRVRGAVFGLVLAFLACDVAAAQEAGGSIIGRVTDNSRGILPGVTVTVTSPALQVPSVVDVTNELGEYRLSPLPIGLYTVTYELPGFQSARREGVRLTVGFVAKVDIELGVGSLEETITVSGASPVVDVTSTSVSTQFTKETLELLPGSRNGVIGVLAQAPGVRTVLDVGGNTQNTQPASRTFGQGAETWYTLEGTPVTDMKGLGGAGVYFDYSIVDEARVQTLGADAQFPTRGVQLQMVVKSGGNQFHGTNYGAYANQGLQSNNINDTLRAQGLGSGSPLHFRKDYSADIGGKIVENKLWFYLAARHRSAEAENLGAVNLDGSPALNIQGTLYLTEKVSYQMTPSNRFIGFFSYTAKHSDAGATQFLSETTRANENTYIPTIKVEWQGLRGNMVANLQHGSWGTDGYHRPMGDPANNSKNWHGQTGSVGTLDLATQLQTGLGQGQGQASQNHRFNQNGSVAWYKSDWFHGNHNIKVGFDNNYYKTTRSQLPRAPLNYQLVYRNRVPEQIRITNSPTYDLQPVHNTAVYLQDSWTIGRRVTLNLGARYMRDNGFVSESCREAADFPGHLFAPAGCFPKTQLAIYNSFAPRLRGSWDITGGGRTVLKGGWGRFPHLRYSDPEVLRNDPNRINVATYRWADRNNDRLWQDGETNLLPNGPDFLSASLDANAVPNPNEKQPVNDEFSMTLEHEVFKDFAVRVTGVYSRYKNILRMEQTYRPYSAYSIPITRPDPGVDGVVNTADDPGRSITFYEYPVSLRGNAFEQKWMVNDPNADQDYRGLDLSAFKRYSNGWQFSASYTTTKRNNPFNDGLVAGVFTSQVEAAALTPNEEINRSDQASEWGSKLSAAYQLPWGFMVSGNFESRSGQDYARQVLFTGGQTVTTIVLNAEPMGTRRLPTVHLLDTRIEKSFRVSGASITGRVNIYNTLNKNTTTNLNMRAGSTFERPTSILPPRIIEFGGTISF